MPPDDPPESPQSMIHMLRAEVVRLERDCALPPAAQEVPELLRRIDNLCGALLRYDGEALGVALQLYRRLIELRKQVRG